MRRWMTWMIVIAVSAACLSGCGGGYVVTVPDQVAAPRQNTPAVVRIERREFANLAFPVADGGLQFRCGQGPVRAAYTDKKGYAGAAVPVGGSCGKREMTVGYMDIWGDEAWASGNVYVWHPRKMVVAVDLDALPPVKGLLASDNNISGAKAALAQIARKANILYLTQRPAGETARVHAQLAQLDYPDGPVLTWQREAFHFEPMAMGMQKMVIQSRMLSQIAMLRETFKNFAVGVCTSEQSAEAFSQAGLAVVMVGPARTSVEHVAHARWDDLAKAGVEMPRPRSASQPGDASSLPTSKATSRPTSGPTSKPTTTSSPTTTRATSRPHSRPHTKPGGDFDL